ncbi:hypothetical protein SDC9_46164 [bioreactor metagenome]|uniref:Zinc-ribbon domain-containing protein n=1 Tax=bioreactor metagenome TaxID=1076179 RepID=A0A644WBK4_9ZZZZ|nr:zinc ribbon domain-containing protein [Methanobrevibacter sp.]MEA4957826.1 zinc ribbon domain-containing protein [Methanobrevibacter sp.]
MSKYCSNCGTENKENSTFCRGCGERLSKIHSTSNNNSLKNENNKILIGIIIALIIIIAIIGTYAFVTLNNNENSDTTTSFAIENKSNSSVSNVNTKSWHKIDSFSGVGDKIITLNAEGNKIRVTSSAMPIKNYADNFMYTTVTRNGYDVGSSQLSWNSNSAVATKSDSIEFTGSGTHYINVLTYELQYWNLEIYEYY